jgi:prepilin-type N-terminal cleavage/methylation domain-containing protein
MKMADDGFSLVETLLALGILAVVAAGVLPLGVIAVTTTENQGHLMARTTEYAQDKLEQLLVLSFNDTTTDTRVFPANNSGGTGLAIGGSSDTAAPVALYVDYLDINGTVLASAGTAVPANWFYRRVWRVSAVNAGNTACPAAAPATGCLKEITVSATVRASAAGGLGLVPRSTVAALKTYPF